MKNIPVKRFKIWTRCYLKKKFLYKKHMSTFIKLPFVIKIYVLLILEWLLKIGFTVHVFTNRAENSVYPGLLKKSTVQDLQNLQKY